MRQEEVISRLAKGEALGGCAPERIDTHISVVFLTADRAYKLKRAVKLSYLDYASLAARQQYCEAEIAINRRTAPEIYLKAAAVTLEPDGGLALDGDGEPVEWVVEMARFDTEKTFDRLAASGDLDEALVRSLADEIASFHAAADSVGTEDGVSIVAPTVETGVDEMRQWIGRPFAADDIDALANAQRASIDAHRALLDGRAQAGKVRHCHGDLHLRNICLVDGKPTIFDAIEFSDAFSNIDVLYDLAFLLMDFCHACHGEYANLVLNRYLVHADEFEGLPLIPLFQSLRAMIRAHVTAKAAGEQATEAGTREMRDEADAYLRLARDMLKMPTPRLVALGGFSGTGKSTLARRIAPGFRPAPGAVILNSDPIRKALFGKAPEERLPQSAYAPDTDAKVFWTMFDRAESVLKSGFSVVLDMTFRDPELRARAERTAAACGVPFSGFWLHAAPEILVSRVAARTGDTSDATTDVLQHQLASGAGEIGWEKVDTGASLGKSHDRIAAAIEALHRADAG